MYMASLVWAIYSSQEAVLNNSTDFQEYHIRRDLSEINPMGVPIKLRLLKNEENLPWTAHTGAGGMIGSYCTRKSMQAADMTSQDKLPSMDGKSMHLREK